MSDVDNDDERRTAFFRGKVAGITLGLAVGFTHDPVVGRRTASPVALSAGSSAIPLYLGKGLKLFGFFLLDALFGFKDETCALVEVYVFRRCCAVSVMEFDGTIKYIGVLGVIVAGGVGFGDVQKYAQFLKKGLVIAPFCSTGRRPSIYKFLCLDCLRLPILGFCNESESYQGLWRCIE